MPQDKDELLQVLITKYAQMYMKLAYAIGAADQAVLVDAF